MVLNRLKNKLVGGDSSETSGDGDGVDVINSENQSILMGIISQLRPGCDLTRITLPTFILEHKSMLERITNAFFTPDILLQANDTVDNAQRFALIVKWYLSSWHIAPKAVKKPLNPVLGEVYSCYWDDLPGNLSAYYLAEQTSHHPPESSYFYLIPDKRIRADGVLIPRSRFLGNSSAAMMEGVAHLELGQHNGEIYSLSQPNIYCRGILFGKLRYELGDHMLIKCEKLGLEADIEFKTKGFISGDYDVVEGTIKDTATSQVLFIIRGKWNEKLEIEDTQTGETSLFYDTTSSQIWKPKVKPLEKQLPNESRKLWAPTLSALEKNDHAIATDEKFIVEERQRELAQKRRENNERFVPEFFEESTSEVPFIIRADINIYEDSPENMKSKLYSIYDIET